jgi:stage IV sporulation protein A
MPSDNSLKSGLIQNIIGESGSLNNVRDALSLTDRLALDERISGIDFVSRDFGTGTIHIEINVPRELFYQTLSEQSDFEITDDGDLAKLLVDLSSVKREYDRLSVALNDVREKGYGIVMPTREELRLEEPEIVRQGGRYGVKLKASAPSIHMIMANIETEVSPAVGGERASEDVINFLLQEFEGDISKIWESNMFGKSLYDIAGDSLGTTANKIPEETKLKLRNTVQRIINDGSGRIICIIL